MNDWIDTNELTLNRETVRDLVERASPEPARLGVMDPDADPGAFFANALSYGSGPVWCVSLPEHPLTVDGWSEKPIHAVATCWTGNGPTSLHNARLYAAAPRLGAALLEAWDVADDLRECARNLRAEVERLREVAAERSEALKGSERF